MEQVLKRIGILSAAEGPAPGYRHHADGTLSGIGSYGYSWASMGSGINSMYLNFYGTSLNPGHANHRAYSFPLRCLSE